MSWTLVYSHDEQGKRLEGELRRLRWAVRNGRPIRVVLGYPNSPARSFAFEPAFTLVEHGNVFALGLWRDWIIPEPGRDIMHIQPAGFAITICTSGKFYSREFDGATSHTHVPSPARWYSDLTAHDLETDLSDEQEELKGE